MCAEFLTLEQASAWATDFLGRTVEKSNINYLVQYGRIKKRNSGKTILVSKEELKEYYQGFERNQKKNWSESLGDDLDFSLAFDNLQEKETTKHVHRLHPYKGKFIPQLVEHFLRRHFKEGDIILDPFAGSGTTLVQAAEMGISAIGVEISQFNALISNVKTQRIHHSDFPFLQSQINSLTEKLNGFVSNSGIEDFDREIKAALKDFNEEHFPSPDFKRWVHEGKIDGKEYGLEKERIFNEVYRGIINGRNLRIEQENATGFLGKWYLHPIREELDFLFGEIQDSQKDDFRRMKDILLLILSRTMRSCRMTTHTDLGTLKDAATKPYYCQKHGKICKPVYSIKPLWNRYAKDTVLRLKEFDRLRKPSDQHCFQGDARTIPFARWWGKAQKARGIFSSPPYLGVINYHEQHAYAYEMFGLKNNEDMEIGLPGDGQGKKAKEAYIEGIAQSLINLMPCLQDGFDIFLVANDKHNLYPKIAERAGLLIHKEHKRPVINRTERNKSPYGESIFHLKQKRLSG